MIGTDRLEIIRFPTGQSTLSYVQQNKLSVTNNVFDFDIKPRKWNDQEKMIISGL